MKANIKEDIHRVLKRYWSYENFRPLQEEIILSVLAGKDTLALLPTGGGKSICFQVPGLVLGGTTLVVSPLISLMNDQVQNLKKRGVSAVAISAALNYKEIDIALNNAAYGHVQFLYVSPERLQNEDFRQKLSYLPITLLAVDEAHCISQWGYDFRPSYLQINTLKDYFSQLPLIALTASATKDVVDDIQLKLGFKEKNVFRQSFERKNLRYVVQEEENKPERLIKLIQNLGGSGLVYVRNRKMTESLTQFLKKNNISSTAYHAGLKYEERQKIQKGWMENKTQVICATNAFGMGIDKPDVRFVVHLDLPESLEAYFQEAGRAGRDGKVAYSTIFYSKADQQKLQEQFEISFPEEEVIKQSYQAICNYYQVAVNSGQGMSVDFDLDKICKSYNLQALKLFNSIKFLEKENYLCLLDQGYEPSKLIFNASKEDVYQFQVQHPKYEPLIKALLRNYGGLFENYCHINEKDLAYKSKTNTANVVEQLNYLHQTRLVSFQPQATLPKLLFIQDRVHSKHLVFQPENYKRLKTIGLKKIESVNNYVSNNNLCRQIQLLVYFNEYNLQACGHCDVCINQKPKDLSKIKKKLEGILKVQAMEMSELKKKMQHVNDELWVRALNELIDDEQVVENGALFRLKTLN